MASVSYEQGIFNANPTNGRVPVNAGGYFADSKIQNNVVSGNLEMYNAANNAFFQYNNSANTVTIGDTTTGGYVTIDSFFGIVSLYATGGLRINTQVSATAGGTATHLIVTVNGVSYKIQLLNP